MAEKKRYIREFEYITHNVFNDIFEQARLYSKPVKQLGIKRISSEQYGCIRQN